MKFLIVYDSAYGNTEQIARAIASAFAPQDSGEIVRASEVQPGRMQNADLVIIGCPTYGGKPTPPMLDLLGRMPDTEIKGLKVAAFDTRLTSKLVGLFGFAAGKIADNLKKRGANLILPPEGFFVKGSKGPLKEGETERAARWGKALIEAQKMPRPG